jgi:uncharacterized membrane protein
MLAFAGAARAARVPSVDDVLKMEKKWVHSRKTITSGHVVLRSQISGNGESPWQSKWEIWFDGDKVRADHDRTQPNGPKQLFQDVLTKDLYIRMHVRPDGQSSDVFTVTGQGGGLWEGIPDPRCLGLVSWEFIAGSMGEQALRDTFLRGDREKLRVELGSDGGEPVYKVLFETSGATEDDRHFQEYWLSRCQGNMPVYDLCRAPAHEVSQSLRTTWAKLAGSGFWFPKETVFQLSKKGRPPLEERLTVERAEFGERIPAETFTLAGLGLAEGRKIFYYNKNGDSSKMEWRGGQLVARPEESAATGRERAHATRNWILVVNAIVVAMIAAWLLWRRWRQTSIRCALSGLPVWTELALLALAGAARAAGVPSVDDVLKMEKEWVHSRKTITSGHVLLSLRTFRAGKSPWRSKIEIWFDGDKVREDHDRTQPNGPKRLFQDVLTKDLYIRMHSNPDVDASDVFAITGEQGGLWEGIPDPRCLGLVSWYFVAGSMNAEAYNDIFLRGDREKLRVEPGSDGGEPVHKVLFETDTASDKDMAFHEHWLSPRQGNMPVFFLCHGPGNEISQSLRTTWAKRAGSGLWFPKETVFRRSEKGEPPEEQTLTVESVEFGKRIAAETFTLAGLGLAEGRKIVYYNKNGDSSKMEWRGGQLAPRTEENVATPSDRSRATRNWIVLVNAIVLAMIAAWLLWRRWHQGPRRALS